MSRSGLFRCGICRCMRLKPTEVGVVSLEEADVCNDELCQIAALDRICQRRDQLETALKAARVALLDAGRKADADEIAMVLDGERSIV